MVVKSDRQRPSTANVKCSSAGSNTSSTAVQTPPQPSNQLLMPTGVVDLVKLSSQEYLDKFNVTAYLKDVITLLLENRPSQPVVFISDYFKNVVQGTSPMIRSYRYIKLTKINRISFWDNLVAAYATLDDRKCGGVGVTGADMKRLLHLLCVDFPPEIIISVLNILDRTETCVIPFNQFAAGIYACIMYEDFFAYVERLFSELDVSNRGSVPVSLLSDTLHTALYADTKTNVGIPGIETLPQESPTPEELFFFLSTIDTPEITFKSLVKKMFALTDPSNSIPET